MVSGQLFPRVSLLKTLLIVLAILIGLSGDASELVSRLQASSDNYTIAGFPQTLSQSPALTPEHGVEVLVFTKTTGYRHDSIPVGIAALERLGTKNDFEVIATENAAVFNDASLAQFQAVVFFNTTLNVLDDEQQAAFERYIPAGGGFVGIHSAADTEYDWPWFAGLVGANFESHPGIQVTTITVADTVHP